MEIIKVNYTSSNNLKNLLKRTILTKWHGTYITHTNRFDIKINVINITERYVLSK